MIVTVTPTIQDGTVVRWFLTAAHAEARAPYVSASRNRVIVRATLIEGADMSTLTDTIDAAWAAFQALREGRDDDVQRLATHRYRGILSGPLVPVDRPGT